MQVTVFLLTVLVFGILAQNNDYYVNSNTVLLLGVVSEEER